MFGYMCICLSGHFKVVITQSGLKYNLPASTAAKRKTIFWLKRSKTDDVKLIFLHLLCLLSREIRQKGMKIDLKADFKHIVNLKQEIL